MFLGKLFYFSSKVTTFEHASSCRPYMTRYNNISRPPAIPTIRGFYPYAGWAQLCPEENRRERVFRCY